MPKLSPELTEITGRLLLVGFEGSTRAEIEELICRVRPGGLIFFSRNYPQNEKDAPAALRHLLQSATRLGQEVLGRPLLLAIDHEGGRVQRLPNPFTPLPPPGTLKSPEEAAHWAKRGAKELAAVGFNINLAPVLDLAEASNNFLGDRSFGANPKKVTACGRAVLQAFEEVGILGVGKHFPGLGQATLDPHKELPTINASTESLTNSDLIPFLALGSQLGAIMTTHALYPALDPIHPATFSPGLVDWLKENPAQAFKGAVFTDDLEMGAVMRHLPPGQAAVEAIIAGHDLALLCRKREYIDEGQAALARAIEQGTLTQARLDDAFKRLDGLHHRLRAISPTPERCQQWFDQLGRTSS